MRRPGPGHVSLSSIGALAVLVTALSWLGPAHAFETINRIKESGQLRIALLEGSAGVENRRLLEGLAASLGVSPEFVTLTGHDRLLSALADGTVDLVGQPLAVDRPWPQGLMPSRPVRHADLWLVDSAAGRPRATLGVRYASDAWYQALALREDLEGYQLRVADARWDDAGLLQQLADGRFAATLTYDLAEDAPPVGLKPVRRLASHVALGWGLRRGDRVLAHRVNRYLETRGLTRGVVFRDQGDWDRIVARGRLRLVTLYRPESYFAWSGQLMGLDFELAHGFARHHGLALDVVLADDAEDLRRRLRAGEADIGAALLRADQLDDGLVAGPHYLGAEAWVVAPAQRFQRLTPIDLHGRSVALPPGSPYQAVVDRWQAAGIGVTVVTLDEGADAGAAIEALHRGLADVTILDELRYRQARVWREDITAPLAAPERVEWVWAMREGNARLRAEVEAYWHDRRGSLQHNLVVRKYLHPDRAGETFRAALTAFARDHAISPYDDLVRRYAKYYDFDWRLILAQIFQESRFDPRAVSVSGARGLMQLMPAAASQVGISDLFHPREGIHAGVRYLHWLRNLFEADLDVRDRLWFSLAAYNGGLTHIRAARELAPRLGLDPRRWFDHTEKALAALKAADPHRYAAVDVGQITRYVRNIRERYRSYVHLSEVQGPSGRRMVAEAADPPSTGRSTTRIGFR